MESILPGQKDPYISDRLIYYAQLQLESSYKMTIYDAVYDDEVYSISHS